MEKKRTKERVPKAIKGGTKGGSNLLLAGLTLIRVTIAVQRAGLQARRSVGLHKRQWIALSKDASSPDARICPLPGAIESWGWAHGAGDGAVAHFRR